MPREFFSPQFFDDIFETYRKSKLMEREQAEQEQSRARARGEDIVKYGFDPASVTSGVAELAKGPRTDVEAPHVQAVRDYLDKRRSIEESELAGRLASTRKIESESDRNAGLARLFSLGEDGGTPEFKTVDIGGVPHYLVPTARGLSVKQVPGVTLPQEAATRKSYADDGLANIIDLREMLKSPNIRSLLLRGGGYAQLTRIGSPEAEKLTNAVFQIADSEARAKTGAAINASEMELYFNQLVPKLGTVEGISDRLDRKQRYFETTIKNLTIGKAETLRAPGRKAGLSREQDDPLRLF